MDSIIVYAKIVKNGRSKNGSAEKIQETQKKLLHSINKLYLYNLFMVF